MTTALHIAVLLVTLQAAAAVECPPPGFDTQGAVSGGFNVTWYTGDAWYIQRQMPISYLPTDFENCVTADYEKLASRTLLGYDIKVHNHAENAAGKALGPLTTICAQIVDANAGKFRVAPCFVPSAFAGSYWVVAFDVADGWSVVSGGPPTIATDAGCKTGSGVNESGFWIFTRERQPAHRVVNEALKAAAAKGFDVSVLDTVDQSKCRGWAGGAAVARARRRLRGVA